MAKEVARESAYSFKNVIGFANDNFGVIFVSLLFLIGGFFIGSLWTENQLLKNGRLADSGTDNGTGQVQQESTLTRENFVALAKDLGIKEKDYEQCLDANKFTDKIDQQTTAGTAAGVSGTPGTVVVVNGEPKELVTGAVPYTQLKTIIDKYLTGDGQPTPDNGLVASGFAPVSDSDHLRGNKNAKIVLVEYSDYQCPFCRQFHSALQQAMDEYKGQVAWVYRHYPLTNIHPDAVPAANAAECVAELKGTDAYWKFSDQLFGS